MTNTLQPSTTDLTIPEKSFIRHQNVKRLCGEIEANFLQLGEQLFWIENDKDYLNLGHDTFNSYLADPDVTIGRTMAFMAKEVWRIYIHQLELKSSTVELLQAGVSKLYTVRDEVNKENAMEWVYDCCSLSRTDLREKMGKATGRAGSSDWGGNTSIVLPIYTRDRMENTARHAVLESYPNERDDIQDNLTRFATNLLLENVDGNLFMKFWRPRFRRLWRLYRGWKRRALKSEMEIALLREENAKQFEEIVSLNRKLEHALDAGMDTDVKEDWRANILENY